MQPSGNLMRIVRALFHVSRTFRFSGRTKRTEQTGLTLEEMALVTMCSGTNILIYLWSGSSNQAEFTHINCMVREVICIFFGTKGHFDDSILS